MYACMPVGYCAPSALKSSMLERVVIGYFWKKLGSTASACLMKLTWSAAKMLEYTRSGFAAWMALIVESQRGLVGNGTYQVAWSLTICALGAAFLRPATKALVSLIPNRYFGDTMKIF